MRANIATPDSRQRWSEAEWALRVDLAACYRLIDHFGMTDLVYNHITARVPGGAHHYLINPYGLMYDEVTASASSSTAPCMAPAPIWSASSTPTARRARRCRAWPKASCR
jgi:hypothetical protein